MPKRKQPIPAATLTGWQHIASFLGEPISVVQRWARQGMPVTKEGRFVVASPDALNGWLGRESGKPVHVASQGGDLMAELKEGLTYARGQRSKARKRKT